MKHEHQPLSAEVMIKLIHLYTYIFYDIDRDNNRDEKTHLEMIVCEFLESHVSLWLLLLLVLFFFLAQFIYIYIFFSILFVIIVCYTFYTVYTKYYTEKFETSNLTLVHGWFFNQWFLHISFYLFIYIIIRA